MDTWQVQLKNHLDYTFTAPFLMQVYFNLLFVCVPHPIPNQLPGAPAGTTVLNVYLVMGVAMALNHMRYILIIYFTLYLYPILQKGRTVLKAPPKKNKKNK